MTAAADATAERELSARLRERGQRVTSQRLVIHRALRDLDRHVSAEQVLDHVRPRLPGVSLPTVYATLDLFEQLDLVRRVAGLPGAALYDPRMEPHHHAVCTACGRVEDVEAAVDVRPATRAARRRGFTAERSELMVLGRCAACTGA